MKIHFEEIVNWLRVNDIFCGKFITFLGNLQPGVYACRVWDWDWITGWGRVNRSTYGANKKKKKFLSICFKKTFPYLLVSGMEGFPRCQTSLGRRRDLCQIPVTSITFPIGFLSNGFLILNIWCLIVNMFVRYPSHLLPSPVGFLANGFLIMSGNLGFESPLLQQQAPSSMGGSKMIVR